MDPTWLQTQNRLYVQQKITMMINRYVVSEATPDGSEGRILAFAEQKRFAFKEQVTLYTDESRSWVLCAFKARQVLDLGAGYDVLAPDGGQIGWFRKNFGRSLLRSTWHLQQTGRPEITGRERHAFIAFLRRLWGFIPYLGDAPFLWPYHFDFTDDAGRPVLSVTKKISLRDRYVVDIGDADLDRRLAIVMAVALDALQER